MSRAAHEAGTLRLDLDHTGCIVNDLAAGAAKWERLGFTLTPLSRQRGAVPGREGFHPWATANRCATLGNTYLELIGTVEPAAYNPWAGFIAKNEGQHILALRCVNAEAAYAAVSRRTDAFLPPVARERALDVAGETRTMRFRNIFSRDDRWPEARYLLIEHQTPGYLWQPRYGTHENGARELQAVTLVSEDAAMLLSRMHALGAQTSTEPGGRIRAALPGRGALYAMSGSAYAGEYGYAPAQRSAIHALTVSFGDLRATLELLRSRGVGVHQGERGAWIGPEDTNGFVMHLVQHAS